MTDAGIPSPRAEHDQRPLVLTVVGTDRHPFDRLMRWLEEWFDTCRPQPELVVQHGFSRRPQVPGAVEFLDHDALQAAMAEASVVVSHGGPATITEARRNGHLPLVVPRDPSFDEHVDDHQQLFVGRLSAADMVVHCDSGQALAAALDDGLADRSRYRLAADTAASRRQAQAVAHVGQIVEALEATHRSGSVPRRARVPSPRRRS